MSQNQVYIPRCGDAVKHKPSGEEWLVAYCTSDGVLSPFGYPESIAKLSECEVVDKCSDDQHLALVKNWVESRNLDDYKCLRSRRVAYLYGIPLGLVDRPDRPGKTPLEEAKDVLLHILRNHRGISRLDMVHCIACGRTCNNEGLIQHDEFCWVLRAASFLGVDPQKVIDQ